MIYSVTELNAFVAKVFLANPVFSNIEVKGEISGGKLYPSGHYYFTLKDENASLSCVMFRSAVSRLAFKVKDGDSVIVKANASLYEKTGKFQLIVDSMEMQGIGNLYLRFENLKKQLKAKGYFDQANKKPIPFLPQIIGVATSEQGSVLHDMLHILRRRFPGFQIRLIPIAVQGDRAVGEIVKAIQTFNSQNEVDVIVLARGGGSLEDLWAFNEEVVAEAIFRSDIPIISAIGHETDYTISDFVADLRAPTPSAAAELVLPEKDRLLNELKAYQETSYRLLTKKLKEAQHKLEFYSERPVLKSSDNIFSSRYQLLDQQFAKMVKEIMHQLTSHKNTNENQFFKLNSQINYRLNNLRQELINQQDRLSALNPFSILSRGYTYITVEEGKILSSVKEVIKDDKIAIHWHDGQAQATINKTIEND